VGGPLTVQANWFTDTSLDLTDEDPFSDEREVDVRRFGTLIDLRNPDSLNIRLVELLQREGELWSAEIRCPVKQDASGVARTDVSCSACPIRHHNADDPMTALCDVGVEQERLSTMLVIHRERPDAVERAR
jgi:hypothetical protein